MGGGGLEVTSVLFLSDSHFYFLIYICFSFHALFFFLIFMHNNIRRHSLPLTHSSTPPMFPSSDDFGCFNLFHHSSKEKDSSMSDRSNVTMVTQ